MAKRRSAIAAKRAKKKADKLAGMTKPKGESKYGQKRAAQLRGKYHPPVAQQRPSWFVRFGWAALSERMARPPEEQIAA